MGNENQGSAALHFDFVQYLPLTSLVHVFLQLKPIAPFQQKLPITLMETYDSYETISFTKSMQYYQEQCSYG